MSYKHTFTPAERFAVFRAHNGICFWCKEPIIFADVTIDHIIPEKLQDNEEKLEQVKSEYSLPLDKSGDTLLISFIVGN